MFRNYVPTFITTKDPVFINYRFHSEVNFIWLITKITFFHSSLTLLNEFYIRNYDLKYSRKVFYHVIIILHSPYH